MKTKFNIFIIIVLLLVSITNIPVTEAKTVCKKSGNGTSLNQSCITDSAATTKKINMSEVHYYPNGGTISRSSTSTTSVTSSSTFSYSVSLWEIAEIRTTFGVSASISQAIGISATWNVKPKQYAQVRAVFPQKNMRAVRYSWDGAIISSSPGLTNTNSGYYITAEVWS